MCIRDSVQTEDFDVGVELVELRSRLGGQVGAVASFVGLVRDRHDASSVTGLYLEHYPGMTEKSLQAIVEQAHDRWPLLDVVVVHRVGQLLPADQIVFVQVASKHRAAAFAACEFVMDFLKTDAVFWKRESQPNAERWVESTEDVGARRQEWER